jgi:peptide/nickel transport system ATP-binding protein
MRDPSQETVQNGALEDAGPRVALQIDDLSIVYWTESGLIPAVRNVSLSLAAGQTLGLVGESGSGKTTLALGTVGYLPDNGRWAGGTVHLGDTELSALSGKDLRRAWGSRVGFVSQNPLGAFNPSLNVGRQLEEMGRRHLGLGRAEAKKSSLDMLVRVDMPNPRSVLERYPHQLSGGMLQRTAIAMALITSPELLILDEPTTALDVTTQALVLDLLEDLKNQFSTAILYITHNLGVVARICDRVAVMYAGEVLEEGNVFELFERPLHPYTINLLNCVPRFATGPPSPAPRLAAIPGSLPALSDLPPGCLFAPRCPLVVDSCRAERPPPGTVQGQRTVCLRWEVLLSESGRRRAIAASLGPEISSARDAPPDDKVYPPSVAEATAPDHLVEVRNVSKSYAVQGRRREVLAVDGVTTWIDSAQTLGLVGESGSGKTTLARVIGGLSAPSEGQIVLDGEALGPLTTDRSRAVLRRLQMVFQNPDASLNPRRTVGQAIMRPLLTLQNLDRDTAARRAHALLGAVRLPTDYLYRYPAELSGGEKQRVAVARAFAAAPDLVICDEPISSLDVSVQGSLMNLLIDLQEEQGTSYLFISHDVTAVQHLSHSIAVMYLGALVERGEAARVLSPPYHPYTESLLSAVPVPDPRARHTRVQLRGGPPPAGEIPSGCRFHPRCPRYLGEICATVEPPWLSAADGIADSGTNGLHTEPRCTSGVAEHATRCHIPHAELLRLQVLPSTDESIGADS